MFNRPKILFWSISGVIVRLFVNSRLIRPKNRLNTAPRSHRVVVSLTSYGRRVRNVHVTVVSLLRQTVRPDVVVLWLDNEHWNDGNLPKSLRRLVPYGLTVRYCENLRSYKKLIPTIENYPDDDIITVDDDFYYSAHMVERLLMAREKDAQNGRREWAHTVYTLWSHAPALTEDGRLAPYREWRHRTHNHDRLTLFPNGGSGVLYRRELLHEDVCRRDLFLSLAPTADDVWFYFMEVLQGTFVKNAGASSCFCIPFDNFYQLTHRGARLADDNYLRSRNDVQIRAVMDHYNLTVDDLRIAPFPGDE